MVTAQDLYSTNFYDKISSRSFYGSLGAMNYRIKKEEGADEDVPVFLVTTWPGPYNFAKTPEDVKTSVTFPYENASLAAIADYLNARAEQQSSDAFSPHASE